MKVFEFILLIFSATSFLVYENVPVNTYSTEIKKELKEIGALHGLKIQFSLNLIMRKIHLYIHYQPLNQEQFFSMLIC